MTALKPFITQAKAKGLTDEQIHEALKSQGWNESVIALGLAGLEVPTPEHAASDAKQAPDHSTAHPSISPLMAALHHVLLWFFIGSSTVTIVGVVASLTGYDISAQALAAMIAVTIITFLPYAIMFMSYLRHLRPTPDLVPGKVWSIITVCLHSIAAMIAAITLVVAAITAGDQNVIASAALILGLDLIVVTIYCQAAFAPNKTGKLRKILLYSYLPLLGVLFGILFVLSLLQLGPARHDEQLRKDLTATVQNIAKYSKDHHRLPNELGDLRAGPDIEYTMKTAISYEVCGSFITSSKNQTYSYASIQGLEDSYVHESQFYPSHIGRNCFTFTSASLKSSGTAEILGPTIKRSVQ